MERFFTLFLLVICLSGYSVNHYISNRGNDSNNGISASTPWLTVSNVNKSMMLFSDGDSILFRRGDTFTGQLTVTKSIVVGAYGTGAKPVFNGFATLSNWSNSGNGIWEAALPDGKPNLNLVTINDTVKAVGRWPNTGFLTYKSHSGTISITDDELTDAINWKGAELVLRGCPWLTSVVPIIGQKGGTLFYTSFYSIVDDRNGYFIQRDIRTLDRFGEWYFDATAKKLKMYFGSLNPSDYTIKASVRDTMIYTGTTSSVTIENIHFIGANVAAVYGTKASGSTVKNCNIEKSGNYGVYLCPQTFSTVSNNTFNQVLNTPIKASNNSTEGSNFIIAHNTIRNTGMIDGMARNEIDQQTGIVAPLRSLIEYNHIDTIGYNGIRFSQDSSTVRYNYVHYCLTHKNDGGGLYVYGGDGINANKTYVHHNIVDNSVGYIEGIVKGSGIIADGIYLDRGANNIEVTYNSISNCQKGVGLSSSGNVTFSHNNIYNCQNGIAPYRLDKAYQQISNMVITYNVVVTTKVKDNPFYFLNENLSEISSIGTSDYNLYFAPNTTFFKTWLNKPPWTITYHSLGEWQSANHMETNSTVTDITKQMSAMRYVYNETEIAKTVRLNSPMKDAYKNKYHSSITLQPFTSAILFADPNP